MNARNFFALGIPKLRQNQFGGSLGGPVRLPGYDGRNRTFVFGSYQGIRIRPESAQSTFFPATAAERKGDFSAMSKVIADPGNNQPFPGNIIPANRVDTAFAAAYLDEYLPLPNRPDGSHVEFRSLPVSGNQLVIKGDHVFSSSDRMSIRWFRNRDASANDGLAANNSFRLTGPRGTTIHTGAFNETHIFSPGLLNELNVSLFRIGNATDVSPHNRDAEAFGLNVRRGGPLPLAPRVVVTGRFTVSPQTVFSEPEQTWQVSDKLSWIRNRQSIVAGVEMRIIRHVTRVQNWTGAWDFDGTFTRDALADMMLGRPKTFGQQSLLEDASRSKQYHGFVQDDIKVSRKLTFNLGLRYEVNMPYQQIHGAGTQFLAGKQSTLFPQAARGLLVPGDPGVPPGLIVPDKNNFMPRAGFAWDLFGSGRTALRGAYGIFMVPSPALDSSKGNTTWPWRLLLSINTPSTSKDPYAGTTNPFPYVYQRDIAFPSVPVGANTVDPNMRDGYVQQYNLNLQHQFGNNWIVQAGYVGSVGRKLSISHADNVPVFGPGATAGNAQQRRPYPAFSGITVYSSEAHSVYNSLQVSVNKRFSKGYTAQLAYTFSNSMDEKSATTSDDGSGAQDPGNYKRGERAHSDFYQKHILAMNGIWDIPFAADRGVLTAIIRNWQLTGRARITSGSPFTVTSGRDIALVGGAGSQRPNVTGAARLDPNRATGELLNRYFDTSVFALPQTGSYGNAGRNLLVGPGFAQTDVAVNRRFVLAAEKARFEFRGEIFNLLNNTNFGNPAGSMASPAFGRILSAQDARVIQLGLRFDF